ncbi:hypothetical protein TVAG_483840 [Trichomonas vaginalis G3]|uniref:Right handed beta helix domain-containing protein n=1 Tax=Trichomonas vaginalis (strain ATCC PRA-98 / G3) TaxID=412133 RepID=A2EA27_TRIV3|nr:hypothetical protein TVAGG3_0981020 [Trichomonas vaginalis G3]EAY10473.1 hypothetical protein TVAG_483840 [Trichomonas vaginalis G3]KAI5489299.1 hypothetical protein TVAGG3_0981020 [Trichomonas vaginalis G3]|eukprot:XP_001322696.1 hypothetical protein [Trichomonas vaginalis G3]
MNTTITHLSLQRFLGSPYLSFSPKTISSKLNIQNSHFSQFGNSFLYSITRKISLNFNKVDFNNFQKNSIILNSEEKAQVSMATQYTDQIFPENETATFYRCHFINCKGDETGGGAISCEDNEFEINITKCVFAKCLVMNSTGGAIYVSKTRSFSISKSCFGQCTSELQAHTVYVNGNKKIINFEDDTFSENGNTKVPDTIFTSEAITFLSRSNITSNKASTGALGHYLNSQSLRLQENNFVENIGTTGIAHPNVSCNIDYTEEWTHNNIYFNKLEVFIHGHISLEIRNLYTYQNKFNFFFNCPTPSNVIFKGCNFDFGESGLKNKAVVERKIYDYRTDTLFNADNLQPHAFSHVAVDYCNPYNFRKPFTRANKPVEYLNNLQIDNHPHIIFFMGIFFICILVIIYFLIGRRADVRLGMQRLY